MAELSQWILYPLATMLQAKFASSTKFNHVHYLRM